MRACLLLVILASTTALAVPQKGSLLRIKTRAGAVVMGELVIESAEGFLIKNGQKNQLVKFTDIAEIDELSGASPPPTPPPTPPAAAPSAPPAVEASTACSPECRDGFVCRSGQCVSSCNPPCEMGLECRDNRCIDVEQEEDDRRARAKADALAAIARDSSGFHLGAQAGLEVGLTTASAYVGLRAALAGNLRLSRFDVRGSIGPIGNLPTAGAGASSAAGGTFDLELRVLLGSRFAMGIAGRAGVLLPTINLNCEGPGCPVTPVKATRPALLLGGRIVPAVFRLGAGRNFELAITAGAYALTRGDFFFCGGLQADYLFY